MAEKHPVLAYLDMVASMETVCPGSGFGSDRTEIEDLHERYLKEERLKPLCAKCSTIDFSEMLHPTQDDIDKIAKAGPDSQVPITLRSAETRYVKIVPSIEVKENVKDCRLCSICWNLLRKANNGEEPAVEIGGRNTMFAMRIESFASAVFPVADGKLTWNIPRLSIALTQKFEVIDGMIKPDGTVFDVFPDAIIRSMFCLQATNASQPSAREIRPLAAGAMLSASQKSSPAYGGRVRPLKVENDVIQGWMRICSRGHQEMCGATKKLDIGPIRLINVQRMCIEKFDGPEQESYLALSYTWGDRGNVTLTRSNVEDLAKDGALKRISLPKTIQDSIKLTLQLGFNYIWIDALCIPQDETAMKFKIPPELTIPGLNIPQSLLDCLIPPQEEDAEKWEQMAKMDKIYGGAFMTLIAAGGHGAHAGLPGIGEHSRMHFQEQVFVSRKIGESLVRDLVLMVALRPQNLANDHYLEGTSWNTRGWCWQERVMSKRCLIFTEEQVYWECKKASFCEESHYDFMVYPVVRNSREASLLPEDYEAQRKRLNPTDEGGTVLQRSPYESMSSHYWYLVLRYSLRHLSREKDYLHALTGVLNSLTQSWGEEFFWGLPKSTFEQQLLWSGGDSGERLAVHSCKDFTGSFWGLPFPSWSWLSKKGHVWMPVSDGENFFHVRTPVNPKLSCACLYDKHRPEIICYAFDPKGLSYDKGSESWTVRESAVRSMHSIRSPKPAWYDDVPPARMLPSPWRPLTRYWCKWTPGCELVESFVEPPDPAILTEIEGWEIRTSLALFQLDIDKREGIAFKMGAMDGPQTLVFFWASSSMLKVSWDLRRPSEQFLFNPSDPRQRLGFLQCPAILNDTGQPIGYLNPMQEAAFKEQNIGEKAFEFVVIASYLDSKDNTRKLDVMMLTQRGLVKKRVTVGQINEEDWVKAKRTWKLIALG